MTNDFIFKIVGSLERGKRKNAITEKEKNKRKEEKRETMRKKEALNLIKEV